MAASPEVFQQRYLPIAVNCMKGTRYIEVRRYVSGSPWNKKWPSKVLWDLKCFLEKTPKNRYAGGANGADKHIFAHGWFYGPGMDPAIFYPITWKTIQLGFYGKGTPWDFKMILKVVDYYLNTANMKLSTLGWNGVMKLEDFAYWYLGLDCNGFTGAYYECEYPSMGIDGNDHINFLHEKSCFKEKTSLTDIKAGDLLVRRQGSGSAGRHVALISKVNGMPTATSASVRIAESRGSEIPGTNHNGLSVTEHTLKEQPDTPANNDSYGWIRWNLAGRHKFHKILSSR
jgi:hypothetical protein